jgi:DNA-binding HxlR family transcriptional regulator
LAAPPEPPPEIAATLSVLGGKWKVLILWQLMRRPCRFNELRRAAPGVSQHMLTHSLRELKSEGIITRTVLPEAPPRVEHALSEHGRSLGDVVGALAQWGARHLSRDS